MKKLLIFLALLIAHPASAAFFLRTDCGTVTGPVEADVCAQSTTVSGRTAGHLYIYRSSAWVDVDSAGAGSPPTDATYITQTPNAGLDSEQALSTLATGVLKNTTTTGVLSIATPGTDYVAPTGSGAGLTALNASQLGSGTAPTARLGSGTANSSTFLRGDSTWASPTVSSLSADGANCAAGQAPLGVDAAGAAQGCFDVATQVELNTHSGLTGTGAHGATTTNTASQIVARDGSGNFAAGTITATLTGNVTGNVTGNADTATLAATATTVVNDAIGPTQLDETANYTWTGTHTFTGATVSMNHDQLSELDDDDHAATYVKYESTAGPPAANSCERDGQIQFDTTNNRIFMCPSTGATPIDVGTQSDGITQVTGESGSATMSGSTTLNVSCTPNCTTAAADASPDTLTITISDHVKSVFIPASALVGDGTQCPATPTAVTINSGPKIYTFICAENDASTLYSPPIHMPDSWNGGTVTFAMSYVQTAADTGSVLSDIAAQCRGNGETPSSTWGTEVAIDDAAVTGSNANDWTVSGAVTPAGTCAGGDMLYFRWQVDGTGNPTTAAATLNILGFKMEYTVTGAGSD